jgi:uncharacterized protein (TIGR02145 family)
MKNYLSIVILLFLGLSLNAQAPQGFNYQATVRNSAGELIIKSNVYFKFNVIQGSQTAVPIFTETHYVPTDDLGQVNLAIGQGTPSTGTFSELDWSLGSYYLGIELSINGANDYVAMGTTQLLSVPYALYAENSGNGSNTLPDGQNIGDSIRWDGSQWVVASDNNNLNGIEISTGEVYQISGYGAISSGVIGSDGGYSITNKGVVWSTLANPTIGLSTKTDEGAGAQNFSSTISNLNPITNYYYRAYASNSLGSFYGNTYNFTTSDVLPLVATKPISNISYLGAMSGIDVTNLGSNIISLGIIYNTNPELLNENSNFIVEGEGNLDIENLNPDTEYYVRAFARNEKGIVYGDVVSFTTLTDDLTVTTGQYANLTYNSVEINGNNTNNNGGLNIIERGVIISAWMEGLYLISDYDNYITKNGTGPGTFNATVSELGMGVRYFYRAYAVNEAGVTVYGEYSDNYQFTSPFNYQSVSDIDQNTYKTIVLGNQEWMAENLKVTRFNNETSLINSTTSSFWYNNNGNNNIYTSIENNTFYNRNVVYGNYNICPQGWRIPTKNDWDVLVNFSSADIPNSPIANLISNYNEWQIFVGKPNGFNLKLTGTISGDGVYYNYGQGTSLWLSYPQYKVVFARNSSSYNIEESQYGDTGACIRCIKE